jgi:AcrR family transcriptional regulator
MALRATTERRILDAAEALFATHGTVATPVDAVLARAGVSSATLYRGFASKEALLGAVLERRHRAWLDAWDAATLAAVTPHDRVLAVFDALDAFRQRPTGSRWCAFLGAAAEHPDAPAEVAGAVRLDTDALRARLLAASTEAGAADPAALAEQLLLVVTGDLAMRLREPGHTTATARAIAEALLADATRVSPSGPASRDPARSSAGRTRT